MVKNWAEMDHLDASFHDKVCALERTYEVASVIFNKYCKEFRDLFRDPDRKQSPAKKRKAIRCVCVCVWVGGWVWMCGCEWVWVCVHACVCGCARHSCYV